MRVIPLMFNFLTTTFFARSTFAYFYCQCEPTPETQILSNVCCGVQTELVDANIAFDGGYFCRAPFGDIDSERFLHCCDVIGGNAEVAVNCG